MIEISLTSDGEQRFKVPLDEVVYDFRVIYNTRLDIWSLDISLLGQETISGVALVIGVNLLSRYNIAPVNLYMFNIVQDNVDASEDTLGVNVKMFKPTEAEVQSVSSI